ncbi:FliA/WhiG family RNA polymerase sigma factor [Clostridium sp. HMb25]|jgi:RNA polymerase sigma factor for flagellar operon FliA|uniref:FliA/WhiG family RNA polymerase sigma factor n=2 Tax=Lachnospirales TaxID=3085636 RepID=A0AAW6AP83_CLOSY|nr:FliA/WhiG family RNA polymerase sigma factor [[Clostridium] symbiosum]PKB55039.1 FliA/WhiG family RNA polymerase sigma factor [Clostridium sp. HMb25]KAA6139754.1 FliA/WhiG family RNA polymerase sigma factor [[Clostridium] symbiosum]MBS6219573.1 FliA/WhiG family RNA polymerase sigma factor [[Clostridium] symbiosum]MCR1939748.1 FliA/WhiG family RNA polymerase sigma factor [[Clostridium] symbiosum]MDB1976064.1 FliA/WhiG family RNA polymerase sigma factor [[Clostridium] symbiosum]
MAMESSQDFIKSLEKYQATKDLELRNELTMSCIYIVRSAASQMRGIASGYAQEEDLINQGVLALMDCMDRYDKTKGAKFETYAYMRVRGALIDFIRKQDWVPHRARNFNKKIEEAYASLSNRNMREPDVEEIASYLDIPPEKVESHLQYMNHSVVISLESMLEDITGTILRAEPENRNDSYKPEESLYYKEICRTLTTSIESLKEKERLVITLYYYEELKYAEIAEILEISESRVCQIHTKAITKLKEDLIEYVRG